MVDDDDDRFDVTSWFDDQRVAIAAGVAAVLLLALLIYGVVRVSQDSSTRPDVVLPGTSTHTSPTHTSGLKTLPSTSYSLPSAQTTLPTPPPPEPPEPGGGPAILDTPTTIYNPYATTTTPNAGRI